MQRDVCLTLTPIFSRLYSTAYVFSLVYELQVSPIDMHLCNSVFNKNVTSFVLKVLSLFQLIPDPFLWNAAVCGEKKREKGLGLSNTLHVRN